MVKRYDVFAQDLYLDENGDYVSFEDYEELRQQLVNLQDKVHDLESVVDNMLHQAGELAFSEDVYAEAMRVLE